MKAGEAAALIVIFLAGMVSLLGTTYSVAHENGYFHGAKTTKLYYETTAEFPSHAWLVDHEANHFLLPEDIEHSLMPHAED
jgi:hypothetical protein